MIFEILSKNLQVNINIYIIIDFFFFFWIGSEWISGRDFGSSTTVCRSGAGDGSEGHEQQGAGICDADMRRSVAGGLERSARVLVRDGGARSVVA